MARKSTTGSSGKILLVAKDWDKFQHYGNRQPSWIKLHRSLLTDYDFHHLPVESRALAPMLWLLASEYPNGRIYDKVEQIAFRMHLKLQEFWGALNPLIDKGFFASKVLAQRNKEQVTSNKVEIEEESEPGLTPDYILKTDTSVEQHGQNGKMVLSEMDKPSKPVLTRACSDRNVDGHGPKRKKVRDGWPLDYREQFWKTYPHKIGRKVAIAKLERVRIEGEVAFDTLMAGLAGYIRSKPVDRPWCNPLTWLNQGRWDDRPAPAVKPAMSAHERRRAETKGVINALDRSIERLNAKIETAERRDVCGEDPARLLAAASGNGPRDFHHSVDSNVEQLFDYGHRARG